MSKRALAALLVVAPGTFTWAIPHGMASKCGLVVMEDTGDPDPADSGYRNDEVYTTDDGWSIMSFFLHYDGDVIDDKMGVGDVKTLQISSSWYRETDALVPETVSGYLNFAPEAFTWSVSDESVAVLRDDYPGTTAYSLVALAEGCVDVTLTGPLGKYDIKRIYVLPVDEFSGGGGPDGPKPPDFDDPDPWRFDLGTWVGGFLVDSLLKPFLRPFLGDEGKEWLDGFGERVKGRIERVLRPVEKAVEWVVDTVVQPVVMMAQAATVAGQQLFDQFLAWLLYQIMPILLQFLLGSMASIYFPIFFPKKTMALSADGIEMLKFREGFWATAQRYGTEVNYTIGHGHVIQGGGTSVTINGVSYTTLTRELAHTLLVQDLADIFDPQINKFMKDYNVTLTQKRYDACLIDGYQKGIYGWPNSLAGRYVRAKDYSSYNACLTAFLEGTSDVGLINRRTAEARLFFYGEYN